MGHRDTPTDLARCCKRQSGSLNFQRPLCVTMLALSGQQAVATSSSCQGWVYKVWLSNAHVCNMF
jgi:hypothetical protein